MTEKTKILNEKISSFCDAALIFSEANRRYFTDFPSSDGVLFVSGKETIFFTDSRYTEAAAQTIGAEFVRDSYNIYDTLNEIFNLNGIKKVAVENSFVSLAFFETLREKLPETEFETSAALCCAIDEMREIKTSAEVSKIVRAQQIAEVAFNHILGFISTDKTEKEVALELDYFMLKNGADALSFETIAVSGENSSKPHGVPGNKKIQAGDFVTLDFGAMVDGYHSDMTRTVCVGKPSKKQREVYNTVLDAQKKCLSVLKDGISCFDADKAARDVIVSAGYGENFGHGTGHGVGIEIHEYPSLSPKSKSVLKEGNVVTVEPGIYLPGLFGVRIEDMALITKDGHKNLTCSPKELIIL